MTVSVQAEVGSVYSIKYLLSVLPHRYPFLLLDSIESVDIESRHIVGKKNVTINEPFFQGHFPEAPLMPGVLIIEAMAQTGGVLVHLLDKQGRIAILLGVSEAKFRKTVKPGDSLIIHADLVHLSTKAGKIAAKAYVNGLLVTQAQLSFALVMKDQI